MDCSIILLGLAGSDMVFLIPLIIVHFKLIGTAANLAIFNIFLVASLGGIHEGIVGFTAIGTAKCGCFGLANHK